MELLFSKDNLSSGIDEERVMAACLVKNQLLAVNKPLPVCVTNLSEVTWRQETSLSATVT